MDKRVYEGRSRTAQINDDRTGRTGEAYQTEQKWSPEVFSDSMPTRIQIQHLREYVKTLRQNVIETSQDLTKVERAIKAISRQRIDE